MIESCEDWSCHCSDVPTTMSVCLKIEQSQFQWIMFIIIIITMRVLIVAMVMTENRCCYSNYIISILAILNVNNKTMTVIILIMSITITITISMLYIYNCNHYSPTKWLNKLPVVIREYHPGPHLQSLAVGRDQRRLLC